MARHAIYIKKTNLLMSLVVVLDVGQMRASTSNARWVGLTRSSLPMQFMLATSLMNEVTPSAPSELNGLTLRERPRGYKRITDTGVSLFRSALRYIFPNFHSNF